MREGPFVLAPQAFLAFCRSYPADCAPSEANTITLDGEASDLLRRVNMQVNRSVAPVELRGPDVWELDLKAGHCAIYAVQKRHELIEMGMPAAALSLAVVTTRTGDLHLVLVVRSDRGAVVLDNLNPEILPWTATGYEYRRVQSRDNPMFWVAVAGSRPVIETAGRGDQRKASKLASLGLPTRAAEMAFREFGGRDPLRALPPRVELALLLGDTLTQ
ncbi:transglutaminase-like cysteine peptidase [Bosea lathyri]|uniref:Predicted transglutaminase-like cysteine proteinase n=1 Tax=Bosea lathyri TaxID=1036778 RepID=A0A1H6BIF9_9HYPH|nr:transglutaminase-like cysteine peptidase [Bosea lathyri]SEG60165.1 Predicted transglutaminase-like cysteine proteinase [Bosea lathyri]